MTSDVDVLKFKKDGFLLLKGVFTPSEVAKMRAAADHVVGPRDLVAVPELQSLWSDPRLVRVAKALLGDRIAFFGEASFLRQVFQPGERIKGRHLHHDAKGTPENLFNRQHPPTPEPYPILRFAIYLQDHASMSGGLKLVPGSHQVDSSSFDQAALNYFDVPSMPGDVVAFCNKILHSPYALRRRAFPHVGISPLEEVKLSAETPQAFLDTPPDRRVIFIDFAGHSDLADIYIKGRAVHPKNPHHGLVSALASGTLLRDAAQADVELRLDAGVIETLNMLAQTSANGKMSEAGKPFLAAIPALCHHSQPWSGHFNFVPRPQNDSLEDAVRLYSQILPRVNKLRDFWNTVQIDPAMAAYELKNVS